jgi:hypothetical protein
VTRKAHKGPAGHDQPRKYVGNPELFSFYLFFNSIYLLGIDIIYTYIYIEDTMMVTNDRQPELAHCLKRPLLVGIPGKALDTTWEGQHPQSTRDGDAAYTVL